MAENSYIIWVIEADDDGNESEWNTKTKDPNKARRMAMEILRTHKISPYGKGYSKIPNDPIPASSRIADVFKVRAHGRVVLYKRKFYWFTYKNNEKKRTSDWQFQVLLPDGTLGKTVRTGIHRWPEKK